MIMPPLIFWSLDVEMIMTFLVSFNFFIIEKIDVKECYECIGERVIMETR